MADMTVPELFAECNRLGLVLRVRYHEGTPQLTVRPAAVLHDPKHEDLRGWLKRLRGEIIDELEQREAAVVALSKAEPLAPAALFTKIGQATESPEPYPNAREGTAAINKLLGLGVRNADAERRAALLEQGLGHYGHASPLGLPVGRGPVTTKG